MLAVHIDPSQRVVILGFGLAAFFLYAGFRAWDEEHAIVEKTSESETSKELRRIREREWSRLTNAQKAELAKRLKQIGPHTVWIIRPNNPDCIALAADFDGVFREALWDVPVPAPYSPGDEKLGVTIQGNVVQEAVRTAIVEATDLPAIVYRRTKEEGDSWNKELVIVSIGTKVT
jgi:hypothetical protein